MVDLGAIADNLATISAACGDAAVCAVVKADAYGHGAVEVARCATQNGAAALAVALVEEGIELREAGITAPIFVLGGALVDGYDAIVTYNLTPAVFAQGDVDGIARAVCSHRATGQQCSPQKLHVKIDTGFSRLGVSGAKSLALAKHIENTEEVTIGGVLTHFSHADAADRRERCGLQARRFAEEVGRIEAQGAPPELVRHIAATAACLCLPATRLDMVRVGIGLYGIDPIGDDFFRKEVSIELKPVLRWQTRITSLRELQVGDTVSYGGLWTASRPSTIAVIPVGYADGYPRAVSGRAQVVVRGCRAPVVGVVCMDLCMVDVTDVTSVSVGDEVVLIGSGRAMSSSGDAQASVSVSELASWADTIPYEIVTRIGPRVPRLYLR